MSYPISKSLKPGEDGIGVLLGTGLSSEITSDVLALGDGLKRQFEDPSSRMKLLRLLTERVAFSILSAYSFKPMCLHC